MLAMISSPNDHSCKNVARRHGSQSLPIPLNHGNLVIGLLIECNSPVQQAVPKEVKMASVLSQKKCLPCQGGTPPLKGMAIEELHRQIDTQWAVVDEHHLERTYKFKNFRQALDFTNRVGELAESEGHHPDIFLAWGKVVLKLWTHKIGGLTESDFVFAAKVDEL
jgi:4a-hydroxytetrahydrobiopterin dehydratase